LISFSTVITWGDVGVDERIILKMDLAEIACENVGWIELAQNNGP
jgi:hypothetical protein